MLGVARLISGLISGNSKLIILTFHRVLDKPDPLLPGEPDIGQFDQKMKLISQCFNVLPLEEALIKLRCGELPKASLCVTFDDGYQDNLRNAAPILKKYNIPATLFVSSQYANGNCMWNDVIIESVRVTTIRSVNLSVIDVNETITIKTLKDKLNLIHKVIKTLKYQPINVRTEKTELFRRALEVDKPANLMLNQQQLKDAMQMGFSIGAHTVSHPILSILDEQSARQEIENGKKQLEHLLGISINIFAYPNGKPHQDYQRVHTQMIADCGMEFAVSTAWGYCDPRSDFMQLPRIAPWDSNPLRYYFRILQSLFHSQSEYV